MVCMIVGETFKRLIRMNDRLDVTVSWEGPNPRPGDCRLMLPRLLSFYLVLSPFLFSRRFSHSLTSLSSSFHLVLVSLLPVSYYLRYASPSRIFRLPFRWFRDTRNCFLKRRCQGSLIRGFARANYREKSYMTIYFNILLPLILSTHADRLHVGWQMCIYA